MAKAKKKILAADLFCGAGGTSTGMVQACERLGVEVDLIAINHWDVAIATHSKNHPGSKHLCESLDNVDPYKAIPGGRLDILWASPACTHHSIARGGKPCSDQERASAYHILRWAEALWIDTIMIENVKEFRDWCALGANGRPLKSQKGRLFDGFIDHLRRLNYTVDWRVLNAADYGAATSRHRLFIIAKKNKGNRKAEIIWPEPTHAPVSECQQDFLFSDPKLPWRPAREIIDWNVKGESIFNRKKPLAPTTLNRIMAGLKKFNGDKAEPFLVVLRNHMAAQSLDEPCPTITAGGQHIGVAEPFVLGQQSGGAPRSVSEPIPTVATDGAIALCEPVILNLNRAKDAPISVEKPFPTITATSSDYGMAVPFMVAAGGPEGKGRNPHSVDKPLGTVLTEDKTALVQPVILQMDHSKDQRSHSVEAPLPGLTSADALAVAEPYLIPYRGEREGQAPRNHSIDEPLPTVTGIQGHALIEPMLVTVAHGDEGPASRARRSHSVDEPLPTPTAGGIQQALIEPIIIPQFSQQGAKSVEEPLGTITTTSRGVGLVEPVVVPVSHGKDDTRAHSVNNPLPTVAAFDNLALAEPRFTCVDSSAIASAELQNRDDNMAMAEPVLVKYYGTADAASVDGPLPTVTSKDRFGLVECNGTTYKIDILFRMLRPKELAAAMGFPEDYEFEGTREAQVKQIGNAVSPNIAEALISEQLRPLAERLAAA